MRALSTPSADDRLRFHSNMPVSELIECGTRAIEASVVSSAPLVVETKDRVTHETRLTSIRPQGARGLEPLNTGTQVRRPYLAEPIESPFGEFCWKTGWGILQ